MYFVRLDNRRGKPPDGAACCWCPAPGFRLQSNVIPRYNHRSPAAAPSNDFLSCCMSLRHKACTADADVLSKGFGVMHLETCTHSCQWCRDQTAS